MHRTTRRLQRGLGLIELIMFIVIVGVALAGVLLVMNKNLARSADPMARKQSLAVAESLLEEVELMPFTFCDPDDPAAATATAAIVGAGGCTAQIENLGLEAAYLYQPADESRYGAAAPFDNVNDYHNFSMTGIRDITNTAVAGLGAYSASVSMVQSALPDVPLSEALLITVTVIGIDGQPVSLQGYRTRYAPNAVP